MDNRCDAWILSGICFVLFFAASNTLAQAPMEKKWSKDFELERSRFTAFGENPYFVLKPGYQLRLEGSEDGKPVSSTITVLGQRSEETGSSS